MLTKRGLGTVVTYADKDVNREVRDIPTGLTLTKAWLYLKTNPSLPDAQATVLKEITISLIIGTGQILDDGAGDQVGRVHFELNPADTGLLTPGLTYWNGLKVQLSDGFVEELEQGTFRPIQGVVRATT